MKTQAQIAARREMIKKLIDSAGSTILAVEFTKVDGSHRTMNVQLFAGRDQIVGEAASESRQRAVETCKVNNPNLFRAFDIAKRAWRSINLDTLLAITVRGTRFEVVA